MGSRAISFGSNIAGDTASIVSTATSAPTSKSIYPRGPQLSLENFSGKDFIVKDFVESLSDVAVPTKRKSGGESQSFDPKPFIRAFEFALGKLESLSGEHDREDNDLSSSVRRAEAQHKQHCATLQRKLDQTLESFNSLESHLDSSFDSGNAGNGYTSGGSVALQIGERLEELDRQKRRAEDAKFLITCWQDVSERGDMSNLENMRRLGGGEGKVKCAQIARQLLRISGRLGAGAQETNGNNNEGMSNGSKHISGDQRRRNETEEAIEKLLESLEQDLLEQFDDCRRQHDYKNLRECATALYEFREGASVIARFVNQHEIFERGIAEEVSGSDGLWDQLADPDSSPPGLERSLRASVEEVKMVLQEESLNIKQIFPYHELVLVKFLQRLFLQSILHRLELVLRKADSISTLAFLRTLQTARSALSAMVEELKSHGLTEHPEPVSPEVSAMLDQQLEILFVSHFQGSSYMDKEKKGLEQLYASLLYRFTLYHSRRRKVQTTYLKSISKRGRDLLASAREHYSDNVDSTSISPLQKSILLKIASVGEGDKVVKTEVEVSEADGQLSLDVAKRMLKWLAESVGRGLELSGGSETPRDVAALLKLLLTHMGDIYLDTCLDAALEVATAQENSKTEPDMSYLGDVRVAVSILQLTMTVCKSVLLPLATANTTVRREMEKSLTATVTRIEDKISGIRAKTIDVALAWTSKLLAKQNRADFRPRDDELGLEQLHTTTCAAVTAFLDKLRKGSVKTLEGKNMEALFTELALGFRTLLLEHLKKFQVNAAGGLMVSKDITRYIELLRSLPLAPSFAPSLEVLVELGNMFVIGPEALKDRLRGGGVLTGIDKADLRPYILRREDANSVGVQAVLSAL